MKYLIALLIPSVVHGSAPRRKFISREVRRERNEPARERPSPRVPRPTIIEFSDISFRPPPPPVECTSVVTSNGTYTG